MDPDGDPDRHQNLTHWSLGHALLLQEISSKSVHNYFSYPTDRQTNRQTDRSENITSLGGGNYAWTCTVYSAWVDCRKVVREISTRHAWLTRECGRAAADWQKAFSQRLANVIPNVLTEVIHPVDDNVTSLENCTIFKDGNEHRALPPYLTYSYTAGFHNQWRIHLWVDRAG